MIWKDGVEIEKSVWLYGEAGGGGFGFWRVRGWRCMYEHVYIFETFYFSDRRGAANC